MMAIEHALSPEVINPAHKAIRRSQPARDGEILGR
jgi:hypothetical protein